MPGVISVVCDTAILAPAKGNLFAGVAPEVGAVGETTGCGHGPAESATWASTALRCWDFGERDGDLPQPWDWLTTQELSPFGGSRLGCDRGIA